MIEINSGDFMISIDESKKLWPTILSALALVISIVSAALAWAAIESARDTSYQTNISTTRIEALQEFSRGVALFMGETEAIQRPFPFNIQYPSVVRKLSAKELDELAASAKGSSQARQRLKGALLAAKNVWSPAVEEKINKVGDVADKISNCLNEIEWRPTTVVPAFYVEKRQRIIRLCEGYERIDPITGRTITWSRDFQDATQDAFGAMRIDIEKIWMKRAPATK